ncbi:chromosome segregation protein SMC [Mycobacterium sp. SWH-M1]|nr:chromosome segregation protein SMC [Mycobacterium sp. SWH-M1]
MIRKVIIENYRIFKHFELAFHKHMNIVVGDNDVGKSTVIEAINLALTSRLKGKFLAQELTPYLFNAQTTTDYVTKLASDPRTVPPEILIEVYLEDQPGSEILCGSNNLDGSESYGVRLRITLDPDFMEEYSEFVKDATQVSLVPTEYYKVEWVGFSGNGISYRSIPATASLIDASTIRLQSGADFYLQNIIGEHLTKKERVELSRSYRSLREKFADNDAVKTVNEKLSGTKGDISNKSLSLSIDISQRYTWEGSLAAHLDDLPFQFIGKGEQSTLKILLALARKIDDTHVVLIEEPENHLSFSSLNILVSKIAEKCKDKQVVVTTHNSYVLNKLGLENLILLNDTGGVGIRDLPDTTQDYFKKLSGYDTLRLVLAKSAILVEGPSDELIVQRAYRDIHDGKLPIEDGIDVINVRGLAFSRFLDIAKLLKKKTAVVRDNDGKEPARIDDRYKDYTGEPGITVHYSTHTSLKTLEPQLRSSIGRDLLNKIFGTSFATDDELDDYMAENKTTCALALFDTDETLTMPGYITDAVQ